MGLEIKINGKKNTTFGNLKVGAMFLDSDGDLNVKVPADEDRRNTVYYEQDSSGYPHFIQSDDDREVIPVRLTGAEVEYEN